MTAAPADPPSNRAVPTAPGAARVPARFLDRLLSTEPRRRFHLIQTLIAIGMLASGIAAVQIIAWRHVASGWPAPALSAISLVSWAGFFLAIRTGRTARFHDPALTLPQMIFAIACSAGAYAIAGPARGAVLPMVMVVLMFGIFALRPGRLFGVIGYTLAVFGFTMYAMANVQPERYPPSVEAVHLWILATMMPVVAALAWQMRRLRRRLRERTHALEEALERNRLLATHDELTGLANRRQLVDSLEQMQRRVERGEPCHLALIDLDHFKHVNDRHGHAGGDAVLRTFAAEVSRQVRGVDLFGRWGGEEFLLLISGSTAATAREVVERLRRTWEAQSVEIEGVGLRTTFSAGLVPFHPGEPIVSTVERADAALYRAKADGRNRIAHDEQ